MSPAPDQQRPPDQRDISAGLVTAIIFAVLLVGTFVLTTANTTMPPGERWAALTTFGLLAFAYVLQGSIGVYDALGRVIRHNVRALASLLALIPALYISYSAAVDEFTWSGVVTSIIFVSLPAVALLANRGKRTPTMLDCVGVGYLWTSLTFGLVPTLQIPQQGALVGFFSFSAVPLMLMLLAARGWPGLGFTWFLSRSDLSKTLLATLLLLVILTPLALMFGLIQYAVRPLIATDLLGQAVLTYFFVALPAEIFFRGVLQNGIERVVQSAMHHTSQSRLQRFLQPVQQRPEIVSLLLAALMFGAAAMTYAPPIGPSFVLTTLAGLGYGWVYQRTGKVTASAVTHMLVIWCWSIFFSGLG